jgi:hypothetical protein
MSRRQEATVSARLRAVDGEAPSSVTSSVTTSGVLTYGAIRAKWEDVQTWERLYRRRPKKMERARGPETIANLKVWYAATGDIAFDGAIRAAERHGFDRQTSGTLKRARDIAAGYNEAVFLAEMNRLLKIGRARSVRRAAAQAAVAYFVPGTCFESVVKKLERAYQRSMKTAVR